MNAKGVLISGVGAAVAFAVAGFAMAPQDKYTLRVPNGLAFAEFKGYESWQTIAVSHNGPFIATILGNQIMIDAYKAGIPVNGKPFPDGAKMAKIHWNPKKSDVAPGAPLVPDTLHDVDFMVKDSARFPDGGGWGYAVFNYDVRSGSFSPGNSSNRLPQHNDAKCGVACHTIVKNRDYVFTEYAAR